MWEWTFSFYDVSGLQWKHVYTSYKKARKAFSYYRTSVLTATISEINKVRKHTESLPSRIILLRPYVMRILLED